MCYIFRNALIISFCGSKPNFWTFSCCVPWGLEAAVIRALAERNFLTFWRKEKTNEHPSSPPDCPLQGCVGGGTASHTHTDEHLGHPLTSIRMSFDCGRKLACRQEENVQTPPIWLEARTYSEPLHHRQNQLFRINKIINNETKSLWGQ